MDNGFLLQVSYQILKFTLSTHKTIDWPIQTLICNTRKLLPESEFPYSTILDNDLVIMEITYELLQIIDSTFL